MLMTSAAALAAGCLLVGCPERVAAQQGDHDLRVGGVFTMTNAREGNEVVALARQADGTLVELGSFPTGGMGSGTFEDSANALVIGTADGEAGPNNLIEEGSLLFATNAGSDSITVFTIGATELEVVAEVPSGGKKPVSLSVNGGILYVLNSGESTNDLVDSQGNFIANCTTGTPSITGFTVTADGGLEPIPDSTRRLSGLGGSGCAQISFTPDGTVLVATERLADDQGAPGAEGDEGVLVAYPRNDDGTLGDPQVTPATGSGPFGFTFAKSGELYVTEQFDGPMGVGLGAVASYSVGADGALTATSGSVQTGGTDTCWVVVTDDGRYGYAVSFFEGGRITSYTLEGGLMVLEEDASPEVIEGAADIALSRDSDYLYQLNAFMGTIDVFSIEDDGRLTFVQKIDATGASEMAGRLGLAAF
jgi:6-phosphogluconolactonase (cycloisomerase 2 family)